MARKVSISFSREELWELISNFDMSFMGGEEGNELAEAVSDKLHAAHEKFGKGSSDD